METRGSYEKDDQFCKRVIRKCRTKFVEDLDPAALVDVFLVEEYITNIQARDIQEQTLTSDKNRKILDTVSTKGVKGYERFKMCLKKSHQEHLADNLEVIETEVQQTEEADEAISTDKNEGFKCFACNVSCDDLQLLEKHTKTQQHLDMISEQRKFAETITEEQIAEENDFELPSSITDQTSYRDYCHLCKIPFTSLPHATSHFSGKPHQKKQTQFDSMRQPSTVSIISGAFPIGNAAVDQTDSYRAPPLETTDSVNSYLAGSTRNTDLYCDICHVPFSCPDNAKQHYTSDKHKKKELLMEKQAQGEILPLECTDCNCTFSGQESAEAHFKSLRHKKKASKESESVSGVTVDQITSNIENQSNTALRCDICQIECTGPENAKQHYSSAKHKKKEMLFQKKRHGDILPLSCDICKCNFPGQESAESHFKGAKHQKKKRESGGSCFPMSGIVPCNSLTGRDEVKEPMLSITTEKGMTVLKDKSDDVDLALRGSCEGEQVSSTCIDANNLVPNRATSDETDVSVATDLERLSLSDN